MNGLSMRPHILLYSLIDLLGWAELSEWPWWHLDWWVVSSAWEAEKEKEHWECDTSGPLGTVEESAYLWYLMVERPW